MRLQEQPLTLFFDTPSVYTLWARTLQLQRQGNCLRFALQVRSRCSCGKQARVPSHSRPAAEGAMEPLQLFAVHAHGGAPTCVCLSSRGGGMLLSGGSDAEVNLWSAAEPRPIMVGQPFTCVAGTRKARLLPACNTDHTGDPTTGHVPSGMTS